VVFYTCQVKLFGSQKAKLGGAQKKIFILDKKKYYFYTRLVRVRVDGDAPPPDTCITSLLF
jgi:hypothetical protein